MKLGHNILKGSGLILKKEKEFISKTKSCFVLCWPAFPRIFVASQIFVLLKKVGSLKLRVAVFADIFGSGFWQNVSDPPPPKVKIFFIAFLDDSEPIQKKVIT